MDIFFWLSGFLGTYLLLVEMKKKKGKSKPFVFVILHRILRLWPMYITAILIYWGVMVMFGDGPIFYKYYSSGPNTCSQYWWSHLLFVSNIYPFTAEIDKCVAWSWYISNDFQFFLLQPMFVYLFFHWRKLGLFVFGSLQVACWIVTIVILVIYDFNSSYKKVTTNYWIIYY